MKVKASKIKYDNILMNLRPVNGVVISRYRQAMRNGDQFPPVVLDKGDMVLVCGYHRVESAILEFGPDVSMECVKKQFADEAQRVECAVADNAKHGMPLDGISRKRAAMKLAEMGRDPEAIARLLGVSVRRVEELAGMHVVVMGKGRQPVKHGLEHMAGREVSETQYEEHRKADRGVPVTQCARQLTRWLSNGWINPDNENEMQALRELRYALHTELAKH